MNGINGVINKLKSTVLTFNEETGNNNLYETIVYKNHFLARKTIRKFLNDKVFFETDKYIFLIEGVIFNNIDLQVKYNQINWEKTIIEMFEKKGDDFFNEFRGSFNGLIHNKEKNYTVLFTDHIGDKPIYFHRQKNEVVFSSNIQYIIKHFKKNKIDCELDIKGAYSLLTHGYMIEDLTPFTDIKRLKAGCYIRISNNELEVKRYHLLKNTPDEDMTDEEIIDKIDTLFQQAIKRQTSKNKEYGYRDIAPLSAGLDSRMTTWVLDQQVENILNITYSQSNYLDEVVPKKISAELKTHLLFKTLDNGLSLLYLDEMVQRNSGIVLYGGPAQVWDTFHLLDLKNIGVIHTGMLGDVVVGTYYKSLEKNIQYKIDDGAYSKFLIKPFKQVLGTYPIESYTNQEIYNFYNRGFNGVNMGSPLVFQEFTESYSPFYDIDFLEFCLTIPVEKRWGHYIYDKWVIKKYPEAAKYAHNGRKISNTKGRNFKLFGRDVSIDNFGKRIINFLKRKIISKKNILETPNHMNPFDYWYQTNNDLKTYIDMYFQDNISLITDTTLQKDMNKMFTHGTTIEKTQVLTLLAIQKNFIEFTDK